MPEQKWVLIGCVIWWQFSYWLKIVAADAQVAQGHLVPSVSFFEIISYCKTHLHTRNIAFVKLLHEITWIIRDCFRHCIFIKQEYMTASKHSQRWDKKQKQCYASGQLNWAKKNIFLARSLKGKWHKSQSSQTVPNYTTRRRRDSIFPLGLRTLLLLLLLL